MSRISSMARFRRAVAETEDSEPERHEAIKELQLDLIDPLRRRSRSGSRLLDTLQTQLARRSSIFTRFVINGVLLNRSACHNLKWAAGTKTIFSAPP